MAGRKFRCGLLGGALIALVIPALAIPALAAPPKVVPKPAAPDDLLPSAVPSAQPSAVPSAHPGAAATVSQPMVQPLPLDGATPMPTTGPQPAPMPVMAWSVADAQALLGFIDSGVEAEGLAPADYQPDGLRSAIAAGPGAALDLQASRSFDWLVEDLRDGRTPLDARVQWFAVDPDVDVAPTATVLARAMASHDIAGTLVALDPDNGEFTTLKAALAALPVAPEPAPEMAGTAAATVAVLPTGEPATPAAVRRQREVLRANIERWRWLPRDLGNIYLIANVPEFQVRLVSNHAIIRSYRTVVGKPGRTATPQLAEKVQAVVFNPTWTVPQSIVQGEGLGAKLLAHPSSGYKVTTSADGTVNVVQLPGPKNSLGFMKIDMPNPHAIYLHDTPSRHLFEAKTRAFSHGCIRTEKAVELGMIMAMLGANLSIDDAKAKANSKKLARVPMTRTFPVYVTYFTLGRDTTGQLTSFGDIYARDKPVLASLARPRELHTMARVGNQEVIVAVDPL